MNKEEIILESIRNNARIKIQLELMIGVEKPVYVSFLMTYQEFDHLNDESVSIDLQRMTVTHIIERLAKDMAKQILVDMGKTIEMKCRICGNKLPDGYSNTECFFCLNPDTSDIEP